MQLIKTGDNLFSDGNPATGTLGTRVTAAWLNAVQAEIANAITGFGVALDDEADDQLYTILDQIMNNMSGYAPGDFLFLPYEPTAQQMLDRGVLPGNGGSVLDADYPDILTAWGGKIYGNADATHFYLPPLCGYFPRFWDGGAGVDPDAATRLDRGDATTGDAVGTTQGDQNKLHTHDSYSYQQTGLTPYYAKSDLCSNGIASAVETTSSGGAEARSKNIYIWGGVFY